MDIKWAQRHQCNLLIETFYYALTIIGLGQQALPTPVHCTFRETGRGLYVIELMPNHIVIYYNMFKLNQNNVPI